MSLQPDEEEPPESVSEANLGAGEKAGEYELLGHSNEGSWQEQDEGGEKEEVEEKSEAEENIEEGNEEEAEEEELRKIYSHYEDYVEEEDEEAYEYEEEKARLPRGKEVKLPKYWWRTSGYNLDDLDLPEDPEKACLFLQATLVEESKMREKYSEKIEEYFRENRVKSCENPSINNKSVQIVIDGEVSKLKEILKTFSDSYDDFNLKVTKMMNRCKKFEKLMNFFLDSSKRILSDGQRRADKRELDTVTKGQGLDKMIDSIFSIFGHQQELLYEKALISLEMEQVKCLIYGNMDKEEVDMLQFAELQKHLTISAEQLQCRLLHCEKMQTIVSEAMSNVPSKLLNMRYVNRLKELTLERVSKKITKKDQEREKLLDNVKKVLVVGRKPLVQQKIKHLETLQEYLRKN